MLGARIRSEGRAFKHWMLSLERKDSATYEYDRGNGERLIVSYSEKRAKKDTYNRARGVERLRKAYKTGRMTKRQVNKWGYNKFLEISRDVEVVISEEKIADDAKWDGLKGYITNAQLTDSQIVDAYHQLYNVEQSFRISKSSLEMRPMFHFTERRIRAHICICFTALKVYRELERLLKKNNVAMSVDTVLSIARTVVTVRVAVPGTGRTVTRTLLLTPRQKSIQPLLEDTFWKAAELPTKPDTTA